MWPSGKEDVTPVVRNSWNKVLFGNYINGVFSMDGFLYISRAPVINFATGIGKFGRAMEV